MALPRAFAFLSLALLLVMAPLCCMADNILYPGETLNPGESRHLKSYTFVMQEDCNLVLYDIASPVWASNTGGLAKHCHFKLSQDGNAVIYKSNGDVLWATKSTNGQGNHMLVLQKDRNVVEYGPVLWAAMTNVGDSVRLQFAETKPTFYAAVPANKTTEAKAASNE